MLARLAMRMLLAPLGFTCGLIAGFVMLCTISANRFGDTTLFPAEIMLLGFDIVVDGWTVAFMLAPLVGAPAIVAVLIAEMFAIRSWAYFAGAGAFCAVMPWALLPAGMDGPMFQSVEILACGFVGGLTHWLIAGRNSGITAPAAAHGAGPDAPRPPG